MDDNADRIPDYWLFDMTAEGVFDVAAATITTKQGADITRVRNITISLCMSKFSNSLDFLDFHYAQCIKWDRLVFYCVVLGRCRIIYRQFLFTSNLIFCFTGTISSPQWGTQCTRLIKVLLKQIAKEQSKSV